MLNKKKNGRKTSKTVKAKWIHDYILTQLDSREIQQFPALLHGAAVTAVYILLILKTVNFSVKRLEGKT